MSAVVESVEHVLRTRGSTDAVKYQNLLKNARYSQLINFDYKFACKLFLTVVTTADSMVQNNGKCFIHLKLELLNEKN